MDSDLCFCRDEFIHENKTIWVAELSDGRRVFQDDGRPGLETPSAWVRLGNYIKRCEGDVRIVGLYLWFRSHKVVAALDNAPGYYFANGIEKVFDSTVDRGYYVTGWLMKDRSKIRCHRWRTPELLVIETEDRPIEEYMIEPFFIKA